MRSVVRVVWASVRACVDLAFDMSCRACHAMLRRGIAAEHRAPIMAAGGHTAAFEALTRHGSNAGVTLQAMGLLWTLAVGGTSYLCCVVDGNVWPRALVLDRGMRDLSPRCCFAL